MADLNKIKELFSKATEYLASTQLKEGNWSVVDEGIKEPTSFQKDIVITAQNLRTQIYINEPKAVQSMLKAFYFVSEHDLESKDPLEWWARKLMVINLSNTQNAKKNKEDIINFIKKSQKTEGCWYSFPFTFNLTNTVVLDSLAEDAKIKHVNNAIEWFKNNKAKDKLGWGKDHEAQTSEYTFTANVINSVLLVGEDPCEAYIQKAAKFLEDGQSASGGWPSTKLTTTKITTYATAIATLALMLTSKNPFNEKVENGIDFLIKTASKDGGWPLLSSESHKYYTTYYAVSTLAFYMYLKEALETADAKNLSKYMQPQQITAHYFMKFENDCKNRLRDMFVHSLFDSKAIGSTSSAVERRREMLRILSEQGPKDIAAIIDELKKIPHYSTLNKKSHMTQIKSDIDYLKDIKIVGQVYDLYFICTDFFEL